MFRLTQKFLGKAPTTDTQDITWKPVDNLPGGYQKITKHADGSVTKGSVMLTSPRRFAFRQPHA